jgi:acetyl esterase/lipase
MSLVDELSAVGVKKSCQPVLVVQGLEDVLVLPQVVDSAYNVACQAGSEVHLQLYPGFDHDPVLPASAPSFLQWMEVRFDGVATRGVCSREIVEPFDTANMYAPKDKA